MSWHSPEYTSYLLRLWPTNGKPEWTWRASLQDAGTGQILYFATINELFAFLRERTETDMDVQQGEAFPEQ